MNLIHSKPLILASQSPRRKQLLDLIGLPFSVENPKNFNEFTASQIQDARTLVKANAKGKAQDVQKSHPNSLILGVDTVVAIGTEVLGKPNSEQEAELMLSSLQDKTHLVWTGVYLLDTETGEEQSFEDQTEVDFMPMSQSEIKNYVQSGEPMDKAGSYAIQGLGSVYIRSIRGDFFNVVGLPLWHLFAILKPHLIFPD